MSDNHEIHEFLLKHLSVIKQNDSAAYHATTAEDLSLYEWWVTPHRLDGLPFHDFMMENNRQRGHVFGAESIVAESGESESVQSRFDLANLRIQTYGDTAIASYTLLISSASSHGVQVAAHNESRVIVKLDGEWKVVHVHKSPAWDAPHVQP
jgi:hypothetical protein